MQAESIEPKTETQYEKWLALIAAVAIAYQMLTVVLETIGYFALKIVPLDEKHPNLLQLILISVPILAYLAAGKWCSESRERKKLFCAFAVYAGAVTLSTLVNFAGHDAGWVRASALVAITPISLIFCASALLKRKHYLWIFWGFSLFFAMHSLLTFALIWRHKTVFHGMPLTIGIRRESWLFTDPNAPCIGLFHNANTLGTHLCFFPAILVFLALSTRDQRLRAAAVACIVLIAAGLLMTVSRMAIAVSAISALYPARHLAKTRLQLLKRGAIVAFGGAATIILIRGIGRADLSNITYLLLDSCGRFSLWRDYLSRMTASHLPLGYGVFGVTVRDLTPHNLFLATFVFFGIFGSICVLAIIGTVTMLVRNRANMVDNAGRTLSALAAAFLVINGSSEYVISYPAFFGNSMFLLIVGYLVSGIC